LSGLFHLQGGDVCPDCKQPTRPEHWTCIHCGSILDRYLFKTITRKSVQGLDKDAFWAGHVACTTQWKESGSLEIGIYRPVAGHETPYRAGWQYARDGIEGKAERKRGRRRGLQLLGSGAVLTLVGGGLAAAGSFHQGDFLITSTALALCAGLLNIALGTFALITGESDAVPPAPSSGLHQTSEATGPRRSGRPFEFGAFLLW
jgi:hypothetical protein